MELFREICRFVEDSGIVCSEAVLDAYRVLVISCGGVSRVIIPVEITAPDIPTAESGSLALGRAVGIATSLYGTYPMIIMEDRWRSCRETMQKRLLAHLDIFFPVYARNCEVRRIDKTTAARFLSSFHSYGDAACRYRYGLFLKRHSGHVASDPSSTALAPGELIAVATFSNCRKWLKDGKQIRSYEWTRYACLPQLRVSGGMGRLMQAFIRDVSPDDIMSYADLEWSEGKVYEKLGFRAEGCKEPVVFETDTALWQRRPLSRAENVPVQGERKYFRNLGSRKYRLKLTDYR